MAVRGNRWAWEGAWLVFVAALFIAIRIPLYAQSAILLGWNSDAALFGLMARAMRTGADFPIFFWGQHYLGTFTSLLTAGISMLTGDVGPLALRIAATLEIASGAVFFWLGLRHVFGREAAAIALLWIAAGPSFLFHFTIAPIGAEQLFLVAGLLFWYSMRTPFDRSIEWFVLGLIVGFGTWVHQGVLFLVPGIGVALLVERTVNLRRLLSAAAGFLAGYVPVAIELLRNDPILYRRVTLGWDFMRPLENLVEAAGSDVWILLADLSWPGVAAGAFVLLFAVIGMRGVPRTRPFIVVIGAIVVSAGFWNITTYAYLGAVRYIVPLVPLVYGGAAAGIIKWWGEPDWRRVAACLAAALITLGLYLPRSRQARDVAAARSEKYTNWPGDFDPRPVVAELRRGRYQVCYGEVWVAHKLEWLTSPTVRFVPVRSVHRTLVQSLELIRRPGTKCYVDNYGRVTALSPKEEARLAATVEERARKARLPVRPRYP